MRLPFCFFLFLAITIPLISSSDYNLSRLQRHYPPSFWNSIPLRRPLPGALYKYIISPNDLQMDYSFVIGAGAHGKCYRGTCSAITHHQILGKTLHNEELEYNEFVQEIEWMAKLKHVHVLPLIAITWTPQNNHLMVLSPYCQHGKLRDYRKYLENTRQHIPSLRWLLQIISGAKYIHSKGYAHYDLSSRNIYVDHHQNIVIGDLGSLRLLSGPSKLYVQPMTKDVSYFMNMLEEDNLWKHYIGYIQDKLHYLRGLCRTVQQIQSNPKECNFNFFSTYIKKLQLRERKKL